MAFGHKQLYWPPAENRLRFDAEMLWPPATKSYGRLQRQDSVRLLGDGHTGYNSTVYPLTERRLDTFNANRLLSNQAEI